MSATRVGSRTTRRRVASVGVALAIVVTAAGCYVGLDGTSTLVVWPDRTVQVPLTCAAKGQPCTGTVALRVGGLDSDPVPFTLPVQGAGTVTVTLTVAQYALVPTSGSVPGEVLVDEATPKDADPTALPVELRRVAAAAPQVTTATYGEGGFDLTFTEPAHGTVGLLYQLRCDDGSSSPGSWGQVQWQGGATGLANTSFPAGCDDTGDPVQVRLSASIVGFGITDPSGWVSVTTISAPTITSAEYVFGVDVTFTPPDGLGPAEVTGYDLHLMCGFQDYPWTVLEWAGGEATSAHLDGPRACEDTTTVDVELRAVVAGRWTTPPSDLVPVRPIGPPQLLAFAPAPQVSPQSFGVLVQPPEELGPTQEVTRYEWTGGCGSNPNVLGGVSESPSFVVTLCGNDHWYFQVRARINNAWVTPAVEIEGDW